MNYNFPATRFVDENDIKTQVAHIQSEFIEFSKELMLGQLGAADLEAADLYHSLETYFRMREKAGVDIQATFQAVEQKNESRGYYLNDSQATKSHTKP